ncbi:centrosomal protein of 290 kDa [Rhipicephalus sanguineus]|uniref:centrosomal protein of 290 kDa n=1 Tax=Rhipicephalus sanguineus TaxID=34632 RepID=UPI0020C3D119|nr:centrosomal protein of 290 kDa [Rhipicephalus sanguineus]
MATESTKRPKGRERPPVERSSGEWPFRAATNDVKLRVLEEENEKLQSLLADCTGKVQVLQGEIARLKHHREMKSNELPSSPSGNDNIGSAEEQVDSLKMLLERLWAHFQELQKRYEQKDGELLRAIAESRRHTEEEKEALAQMRIQCSGSVPLEKLENILSQFKSGNQTAQEHEKPSCQNCRALTDTVKAQTEELITSRQNAKLLQKRLDEERRNMQISANSLRVKDTIIQELKQALSRAAAEEHIPWDKAKLKKTLHVAMLTINSLQALMRQKEATIERYRACVASLRSEMQQQNQKLSAEAHVLRVKLLDTASVREKSQQDGDDAAHDKPRHFQDKLDQLRALDEAHREAVRILLLEAAKVAPGPAPAIQTRPASSVERPLSPIGTLPKPNLQSAGRPADVPFDREVQPEQITKTSTMFHDTVISLQKVIEEKDSVIVQKDEQIAALEGRLAELHSKLEEAAKRKDLGSLVHVLKSQVDDKEKQLKALSQALVELRTEMMRAVELHTVAASSGAEDSRDTAQLQNELRAAQEREHFLEDEVRLLREENEALKEKHRKAQEERLRTTKLHKAPTRRGT